MEKLMNICGYWNMNFDEDYNEREMWIGQILLSEDNWFEGIVKNNDDNIERMIMGFYNPQNYIELLKTIPDEMIKAYLYHCDWTINGYRGEFSIINSAGELFCGTALITPLETEIAKKIECPNEKQDIINNEIILETEKLKNRIEEFKKIETVNNVYSNAIEMREQIGKVKIKAKVDFSDYKHILVRK